MPTGCGGDVSVKCGSVEPSDVVCDVILYGALVMLQFGIMATSQCDETTYGGHLP